MRDRTSTSQRVTIKTASDWPLKNERNILEAVHDNPCIRPIVDAGDDPPSLVLKYLDDDLLHASDTKTLEKADIKFVARSILQALDGLHSRGYVHTGIMATVHISSDPDSNLRTDVKPNNILVNNGIAPNRFSEVQLGDCGDAIKVDPNAHPFQGHVIGATIFRSPEAMLNLRWGPPTDIWSFGATVSDYDRSIRNTI